ncbi:SRPBCC domain-containing protein [Leptolyngbya sp. 7M]|uniref:SRPBCC family protein n=1 Tax=Leptolyngbya sp. 7M TaxID=2812896 RepID=UPI001B8CA1B9|nr:SRPBCC domain-containing protein [Leptolyngbya sp. 7M]QYO66531.1 SRPBCC domain-containing protein [Leptolyngbya sp. 7M]
MNEVAAAIRTEGANLSLERIFDAPIDLLFEVWTEPKHLVNWWGPNDFTLPHCDVDFRVGGKYRFCMRSPEGEDHWVTGEYKIIDEPSSLAFTWIREDTSGNALCDTLVSISLEQYNGGTRLILEHTGFDSVPYRDEHISGWGACLDRLIEYVTV